MANQKHADMIKQGVEAWNQWREQHQGISPDLSGADLNDIDLRGANLIFANLRGANLSGTDLREAKLSGTNLLGTDLSRVDLLFKANQLGLDLSMSRVKQLLRTSLRDTDLFSADLRSTDLLRNDVILRANLCGANLSTEELLLRADLYGTDLCNTDLSEADQLRADLLLRASLRGANLERARLRQANLLRADLSKADLNRSDLNKADLSGANLRDTDLQDADLSRANLDGTDLQGANLSGAFLSQAYLGKADLSEARLSQSDLSKASLVEAKLRGTDLSEADLRNALLRGADLSGGNLSQANLSGAHLFRTTFAFMDLRTTRGLAEIDHQGPSDIQLQTVQLPSDGSALHFLRGARISEEWIADYRTHLMSPIRYYSCFVAYAHEDDTLACRLHADPQMKGVHCWFAPEDMRTGDKIRELIDSNIGSYEKLLLILSKRAIESTWVESEVEIALEKERQIKENGQEQTVLFPIRLDDGIFSTKVPWAKEVRRRHIVDFTYWKDHHSYQLAFERLIRDLKAEHPPTG